MVGVSPMGKAWGCHMPGGLHPLCSSCNSLVKEGVPSPAGWASTPALWHSWGGTYCYR